MVVSNELKAEEVREALGDDWYVITPCGMLAGRGFDTIIVACDNFCYQNKDNKRILDTFIKWSKQHLPNKLYPGGKIVEVY